MTRGSSPGALHERHCDSIARLHDVRGRIMNPNHGDAVQLCTFYVDDLCFGIEVTRVQEVIRFLEATYVPLAPDVIGGLINLRGQIVTAIDLRRMLNVSVASDSPPPMNIVVRNGGEVLSLLVDRIGDVIDASRTNFELPPETLDARSKALIDGVYKLEQGLVLAMNLDAAINNANGVGQNL
jgi:purine-binding chemotaxis protein CheW